MRIFYFCLFAGFISVVYFLNNSDSVDTAFHEKGFTTPKVESYQNKLNDNKTINILSQSNLGENIFVLDNLAPTGREDRGIIYRSVNELSDLELKKQIKLEIENFNRYGSVSKGEVTIEFAATDDLKNNLRKKGVSSIKNELAFNPVSLVDSIDSNFVLVGADTMGKFIQGKGWNRLMQSANDPLTGRQVELIENQLESKIGDNVEIFTEFMNTNVGNVKATISTMKNSNGEIVYSIQWADKERTFTLDTLSFKKEEALALAEAILENYRRLPNDGWKTPYVLDPKNPLHRRLLKESADQVNNPFK